MRIIVALVRVTAHQVLEILNTSMWGFWRQCEVIEARDEVAGILVRLMVVVLIVVVSIVVWIMGFIRLVGLMLIIR